MLPLPTLHERKHVEVREQEQLGDVVGHAEQSVTPQAGEPHEPRQLGQHRKRLARRAAHVGM